MLDVDTVEKFIFPDLDNVYKIGVHADGSCLIHSFLYSTDPSYRDLSVQDKKIEGKRYRKEFGKLLLKSLKPNPKDHLKEIANYLRDDVEPKLDVTEFKNVETYIRLEIIPRKVFLGDMAMAILERVKKVNILVMTGNTFYIRDNQNYKETIVIYNHPNIHYEAIAFKDADTDIYTYILTNEFNYNVYKLYRNTKRLGGNDVNEPSPSKSPPYTPPVQTNDVSKNDVEDEDPVPVSKNDVEDEDPVPVSKIDVEDEDPVPVSKIDVEDEDQDKDQDPDVALISDEMTETFLFMEGDILFEDIDLDDIIITRVNKNAEISFSEEQSVNEINELFSNNLKGLPSLRNQLYMKLLYTDSKPIAFEKFFVPVVSAYKQYSTYHEDDPKITESEYENDTYVDVPTFFDNRNQIFSITGYKSYKPKYLEHTNFLFDTCGEKEHIDQSLIRMCPALYNLFMDNSENTSFDVCNNFTHDNKYHRLSSKFTSNGYLESYRLPDRSYKVCGYFSSNTLKPISKDNDNDYTVFNVSDYFESILNVEKDTTLHVTFLDGTTRLSKVVKKTDTIITLRLNEEIEYKSKPMNILYYYITRNDLEKNWFMINTEDTTIRFNKRMLFEQQFLFLFKDDDREIFKKLFVPSFEEMYRLKTSKWSNLQECAAELKPNFNISTFDIPGHFVDISDKILKPVEPSNFEVRVPVPIDFTNAAILKFGTHVRYPEISKSKGNTLLQRIFQLEESFDNGMSYVLDVFQDLLSKEINLKDLVRFEKQFDESAEVDISNQVFYNDVDELFSTRDKLNGHAQHIGLKELVGFGRLNQKTPEPENIVSLKQEVIQFFTNHHKPQSIKNTSFMKHMVVEDDASFEGNKAHIDNAEMYENMESTQNFNTDALGTDDIEEASDTKKFGTMKISEMINNITLQAGAFQLSQKEIVYIENNVEYFQRIMLQDKIKVHKVKVQKINPNIKVFKVFKTDDEKREYIDYSRIIVITCFVLIFISRNKKTINITKLHMKCKDVFQLDGFPLGDDKTKAKSTLQYLSCLLTHVFPNKLLKDTERNLLRIHKTTVGILNEKKELNKSLQLVTNTLNAVVDKSQLKDVDFKPNFRLPNSPVCKPINLNTKSNFDKLTVSEKGVHKEFGKLRLLQLQRTQNIEIHTFDSIKHTNITPVVYSELSTDIPVRQDIQDQYTIGDVSATLEKDFDELCNIINFEGQDIKEAFIVYKNSTPESIQVNNNALLRYSESRLLIPLARLANRFNDVQHIEYITKPSVKHASKPSDSLFLKEMHERTENATTKDLNEYKLSDDEYAETGIATELMKIELSGKDYLETSNPTLASLLCMRWIVSICYKILDIDDTNENLHHLIKYMLTSVMSEVNSYALNFRNFTNDVEQMRERDKQSKFDKKDNMSSDERFLLISLEGVGLNPDMTEFNALYANERVSPFKSNGIDHASNPEYVAYDGENSDA